MTATVKPTAKRPQPAVDLKRVKDLIAQHGVQVVDVKFCDLPGTWQHFSIPAATLDEDMVKEGLGFDGSSIRGFQAINESDMLLMPDLSTAFVDPVLTVPTLSITCDIYDPITLEPYSRDPRFIAFKAEEYLKTTWHCHHLLLGPGGRVLHLQLGAIRPECARGVLPRRLRRRDLEFRNQRHAEHGPPAAAQGGILPGATCRPAPGRTIEDHARADCAGIPVEVQHHEVATAGQAEIDFRFGTLVQTADRLLAYKYIVKNVCHNLGLTATFMPKPLFGDNGSGMHVHQSLWKDSNPLFFDEKGYALLSDTARWYIGGLIAHAPALLGLCAPTTNSYRRLVPGFEAPVNLMYSQRNRSAICRIPTYSSSPKARRVEFRAPDPSCNPYLAFSAMLMAGLDGVKRKIEPPKPIDEDLYELHDERKASIKMVPGSLSEALTALEQDHAFLLAGDVFTPDVIETWLSMKRSKDVAAVNLRPHPYEFFLYYDA